MSYTPKQTIKIKCPKCKTKIVFSVHDLLNEATWRLCPYCRNRIQIPAFTEVKL